MINIQFMVPQSITQCLRCSAEDTLHHTDYQGQQDQKCIQTLILRSRSSVWRQTLLNILCILLLTLLTQNK